MENLDLLEKFLKMFFRCYPAQKVLQHCGDEPGVTKTGFVQLAFPHTGTNLNNLFSPEDLQNQWQYYQQCMDQEAVRQRRNKPSSDRLNPMDCLFFYVDRMLTVQDNQLVCRYERLLNWQMLTLSVSSELLASAFWAMKKMPEEMTIANYSWKLVLGHDNYQLNRIFERGLAENHFHLYGSAPIFQLSWVSLMNVLTNGKAAANLRNYDRKRLEPQLKSDITQEDVPLTLQHYQAAAIRLVLFSVLTGYPVLIGNQPSHCSRGKSDCPAIKKALCYGADNRMNKIVEYLVELLQTDMARQDYHFYRLQAQIGDIQGTIDSLRDWYGDTLPDYAMLALTGQSRNQDIQGRDAIFIGERWLLYQCLHLIYYNLLPPVYVNLFYAYLLIKEKIRQELLQTDEKVGFSHFQDYERRKFDLMDDQIFKGAAGMAAWTAVRENILNPNIRSLEIRITPYLSAKENVKLIDYLDEIIGDERNRYFYTFHFLKRDDDWREKDPGVLYCRHNSLRRRVMHQTKSILEMRDRFPLYANRILGIDAASRELGCRPEVFAVAFRMLHGHTAEFEDHRNYHGIRQIPQIRRTYHVGEDFQDVTDGLRAIDEAIRFLNLESGDRLGHAIALGVDVREWYRAKNNTISLTRQQFLDDVVWLYHKLVKYKLEGTEILQEALKREYSIRFRELYLKHIPQDVVEVILIQYHQFWNKHGSTSEQIWAGSGTMDCDIYQYYMAWKLRGDDPQLYSSGYFRPPEFYSDYERSRVNNIFPGQFNQRFVPEVFLIHYFYHYSRAIREEGEEIIQVPVSQAYIEGVELVQREFRREVGRLGLAIETNPTSNYMVGTFKRYDRHPILNFYNRNLEVDSEILSQNPQLLVSINTDDQGVFSTSLENEYSLMACALEKAQTEDGQYRYPRQRVYAWLEDLRIMGLEQTFGETPV